MKRLKLALITGFLLSVLSACGVIKTFIPEQSVTDPLGIDGQSVEFTVRQVPETLAGATIVTLASTTVEANSNLAEVLPDIPSEQLPPAGLEPERLSTKVGFGPNVIIRLPQTGTSGVLPDSFTLSGQRLDLSIADNSESFSKLLELNETLVLQRQDCSTALECSYQFADAANAAEFIDLSISGAEFDSLYRIISAGGENTVTLTVTLSGYSEPGLPEGSTLSFELRSSEGKIAFN